MSENSYEELLIETARLYDIFKDNGDSERMQKTRLFADKLMNNQFIIGFAGHFSAGKSTMINALTGDTLLPSSPIPTSANIVTVENAPEDFAVVYMNGRKPVRFPAGSDFSTVKRFAKSGDVSRIELGHAESSLPEGLRVMDTPGVDSTDDAHRLSTESALHVADMVFYVMDYNHVQSELNFTFTKELQKYTKVYLIVNQIDKHQESELPFEQFKQSVAEAFRNWHVEPEGIFFTSLKKNDAPGNDFVKVKELVDSAMGNLTAEAEKSARSTLQKLKDEHMTFLNEEKQERLFTFENVLTPEEWQQREDIKRDSEQLKRRLSVLDFTDWRTDFEKRRRELLDNAVITPYEMREALTAYLEARQPDFKVGFLFSAKKTEQERAARKEALIAKIQSAVDAQITPHIRNLMKLSLQDVRLLTDEEALRIESRQFDVPFAIVEEEMPDGPGLTGTTVLNVSERLSARIKQWAVAETDGWKNEQEPKFESLTDDASSEIESKDFALTRKLLAIQTLEEMEQGIERIGRNLGTAQPTEIAAAKERLGRWQQELANAEQEMETFNPTMLQEEAAAQPEEQQKEEAEQLSFDQQAVLSRAVRTAAMIGDIKGFTETAQYLKRKAETLDHQNFTIALFGAFSAGKSSFSNALLGDKVLPVSPNPTTAAINRIRPVSPHCPHETADVHLKTADMLKEDVKRSFSALGITVKSVEEAYRKAPDVLKEEAPEQQIHKAFIAAFQKGYPEFKSHLGTTVRTDRETFQQFVAQEDKSCFVDTIDFYYDSELTRNGVTLVDTPGADSINARHTGVAFDYIRNADAVLFLTYFNHAFARADREFLIQLGRVKDAFEMDKMFFIVNAIDLAADEAEQEEVKDYVRAELQRFGIRFPRLFGVSSLLALTDRQQSGMPEFDEAFQHFLKDELKGMALQSLHEEEQKAVNRFHNLIVQTEQNLSRKEERLKELTYIEKQLRIQFSSPRSAIIRKEAERELSELLFYVNQRVFYRFNDFFKEAYNPSLFTKKSSGEALPQALSELVQMAAFDFEQEIRATSLRMIKFIERKLHALFLEESERLKELNPGFSVIPYEAEEVKLIEPDPPFAQKDYSAANRLFKNTKDFFEKNGKEKIRTALQERMEVDAKQYLDKERTRLEDWVGQWAEQETEGLRQHMLRQTLEEVESERMLLKEQDKLAEWKNRYDSLKEEGVESR